MTLKPTFRNIAELHRTLPNISVTLLAHSFQFASHELDAVERLLSQARLGTYMSLAGGDRTRAFHLYAHNLKLSSALFEVIGGLEVALRNSVHLTMAQALGTDAWYDSVPFAWKPQERQALQRAKAQIRSRRQPVLPGRVVAELTFGFWCGLTGKVYSTSLWIPYLHKAFAQKRLGHREVHQRLDAIRKLRNRIAHHECILQLDLAKEYSEILSTLNWICPITRSWVEGFSAFPTVWQSPPP